MLRKPALAAKSALGCLLVFTASLASAATVYITDDGGRIGLFDTVTNTGVAFGSIANFSGQVIGLAYRSSDDSVIALERSNNIVYSVNGTTGGAMASLFTAAGGFQGGAVSGGLLYGTFEGRANETPVGAFNFTGTQVVTGSDSPTHTHAMGVDASTGQLYAIGAGNIVRRVNADGTYGTSVVTASIGEFADDIDYFGGDFLVTQYSAGTVLLVNGTTGASSVLIDAATRRAMGLSNVSGVVVRAGAPAPVPEPAGFALVLAAALGLMAARRRQSRR